MGMRTLTESSRKDKELMCSRVVPSVPDTRLPRGIDLMKGGSI